MNVPDLKTRFSPWYVTGFADGEGIFTYSRGSQQLMVVFAVRLTATDRSLLESIKAFFGGAGRIYSAPRRLNPGGGRTKSSCYYRVNRPNELLQIVDHFDTYPLQGEKLKSYRIWREMVFLRAAYHGVQTPSELLELAKELSRTVPRHGPWI